MAAELTYSFILRTLLVLSLVCIFGADTNCKSVPIDTRITEQKQKAERAKAIGHKYIPEGKERDEFDDIIDSDIDLLETVGKEYQKASARADANEAAASKWHWLIGIGITGGIGWVLLKIFKIL